MGFGTENHGLNLQFASGLFRQVELHVIIFGTGSDWSTYLKADGLYIYASGRLDKFHCIFVAVSDNCTKGVLLLFNSFKVPLFLVSE